MSDSLKDAAACFEHNETVAPVNFESRVRSVSYSRGGMRGLVSNTYVTGAAFLASLGGFSFGYDQGVISIINIMSSFHQTFPPTETAFGKALMTSMLLLGALVGCLGMPYLCDKISRKWALTTVVVVFNIGAIMQTAAQSYGALVAGRAIGGMGVGTLAMVKFPSFFFFFFLFFCD
jgi:predicted MFS family arabinose efflux permease